MAKSKMQTEKLIPPQFEFEGEVYEFQELTVGQMEILSEILHESRKKMFEDLTRESDNLMAIAKVTASIADIIFEIKRQHKYALFIAACMVKKGGKFDEAKVPEMEQKFKNLPADKGEEVERFFFAGEKFAKLLIPSFLTAGQATRVQPGRSGK